jgi:hypothetical protein
MWSCPLIRRVSAIGSELPNLDSGLDYRSEEVPMQSRSELFMLETLLAVIVLSGCSLFSGGQQPDPDQRVVS